MPPGPTIGGAAGDVAAGPGGPPCDVVDPPEGVADATAGAGLPPVETAGGLATGDPWDGGVTFAFSAEDASSGREATVFWIAMAVAIAAELGSGLGAACESEPALRSGLGLATGVSPGVELTCAA